MAIFSWKKSGDDDQSKQNEDKAKLTFSPEAAAKFFDRARTVGETGQNEYAMQLWLSGLRHDPSAMPGIDGFFKTAARYLDSDEGRKGTPKDVVKSIVGKTDVDKYLLSLLEWGMKPAEAAYAVKAFESASGLGLTEVTGWIGDRAFPAALRDKKPRKDWFLKLMDGFEKVGAFEKAVAAGEAAYKVDPTDGELGTKVKNLAAQMTMSRGGYEKTGQAGGFRANVRDAEKQRQLDEADRIVKSADSIDRLLAAAEDEFAKRPDDLPTINTLIKRLLERGRPEDEARAMEICLHTFEKTKQFRFRQGWGEIKMRQERRRVLALRQQSDAAPADEALKARVVAAEKSFAEADLEEYRVRVENYPTDLTLKFELGKRYYTLGHYDESIACFQESQHDVKNKAESLAFMANAFAKMDWLDESIATFRSALEIKDLVNDVLLDIRYGLMLALQAKAERDKELTVAEEADKVASSIAMQQISYRDIRARRVAIKELITRIKAG